MVVKTDTYFIVIDGEDKLNHKILSEDDIKRYCDGNECITYYAFIRHYDEFNEMGEKEETHYHLFIRLCSKYSKTTIINDIAKTLLVNTNIIHTRKLVKSVSGCIRYLIHADDENKKAYAIQDIISNDYNETLSLLSNGISTYDVDIEYLIDLVRSCKSLTQIYRELGMKKVRLYRSIINDLWKERCL